MNRSQRRRAVCALTCTGLLASHVARAEGQAEATRLEFHAPQGCSSAGDFAARVSRRSARIHLVTDAVAKRSLVVEIQPPTSNGAVRGTVTVVEVDGVVRARQLKAASCEEAVEGLALIATVTLDPDALLDAPEPGDAPVPASPAPRLPPPTVEPSPVRPRESPAIRDSYRVSVGLAAALLVRAAPEPAFGGAASVAFELWPGTVVAPFLRLSLTHAERRQVRAGASRASFAFTLPTAEVCALRLGPRRLGVRPCAFASVGLLKVWGSGTLHNETHARSFAAAGLGLWVGWRVSEILEIIADGRVGAPFARDRFAFDDVPFFTTPTPAFSAGLGAAGGFP